MKSTFHKILLIANFISYLLFCLLAPIPILVNWRWFYLKQFSHYNVVNNFNGVSFSFIAHEFEQMISYLNFSENYLNYNFFSPVDIIHLSDLRILLFYAYLILLFSIPIFLISYKKLGNKNFKHNFRRYPLILTLILTIVILTTLLNFEPVFIGFHKMFFNNNFWMLDPDRSNLIKFFPVEIFRNLTLVYLCLLIFGNLVIFFQEKIVTIISLWIKKLSSQEDI